MEYKLKGLFFYVIKILVTKLLVIKLLLIKLFAIFGSKNIGMKTPFVFGKIVTGEAFTNRESETQRLMNNFQSGTNTVLISPRRWGKSSLVFHAAEQFRKNNKKIRFIFLDLFKARTEEQFYEMLAKETIRVLSSRMEDIVSTSRTLLGRFLPKVSFNPAPGLEFELSLDWDEIAKDPDDIIEMPEKLARQKKCKVIVCVDEFQNIAFFDNHVDLQKKLRAVWQTHQKSSYCLYGSKKNMLMNVFSNYSMPFYKFGDIIFLKKIKQEEWHQYIFERFQRSKKTIETSAIEEITLLTKNHPHYVQQLAQLAWLRTRYKCDEVVVKQAFEGLIDQLSMLFQSQLDTLSRSQINFLKAILDKPEQISASQTISKYRLGSSANIQQIKKALIKKEMIDVNKADIELLDPVFEHWLREYYFAG